MHPRTAALWLGLTLAGAPGAWAQTWGPCLDLDRDGFAICSVQCAPSAGVVCGDCDDRTPLVRPGLREDCDNVRDDDCNGLSDLADPACSSDCRNQPWQDADGDVIPDCRDNCLRTQNPLQLDFDGDGAGDACETGSRLCDVDASGRVDGWDLTVLGRTFARRCGEAAFDRRADLTRDCRVDGEDLAVLAGQFGSASSATIASLMAR